MKSMTAVLMGLLAFSGGLCAQPLSLTFDASVTNAEKEADQIPLIPTQFEFQRSDGSTSFNDSKKLYSPFKRAHGPYFIPPAKLIAEGAVESTDRINYMIKDYPVNIPDLSLKTSTVGDLYLRSTGFLVFPNYSLIQTTLLIPSLCETDAEKNEARCKIKFPSVQIATSDLANISSVRVRVFRKGEVSASEIQALPIELIPKLEEHLKENARAVVEDDKSGKRSGYFLYANFHFEATLKESNEGMPNEKTYEWRYALSQAYGRLALLAGEYQLEREILYSDGKKEILVARTKLGWGVYKGKADLDWTKVEDPRDYHP